MNTTTDNVYGNVMLVDLRVSQWTGRKMDKRVSKAVADANSVAEGAGRYYKTLLDPAVMKDIQQLVTSARNRHYAMTLPWSDEGPRVLSSKLYFTYMQEMREYKDKFLSKVNGLLSEYPYHREEAKRLLGNLFSETDYPTPEELSGKYGFHVRVLPLPKGSDFRCNIPDEELAEVRQQMNSENDALLKRATDEAYARVHKVASAYVDRLAETDTVFRDSLVWNARELVDLLPALNITNDPRLDELTDKLATHLGRHDPKTLRTSMGARKETYEAAKEVVSDIESVFGGNQ